MSRHHHKKSTQLTISDTLTIPSDKPDIEFLLRMTATPTIDTTAAKDKKVNFSGHILICIEYVAGVPDSAQPVHFVSFELPFDAIIDHRFARTGMNAQLQGAMTIQEFQVVSPRNVKLSITFKACLVRLAQACKSLPPHACKPRFTNLCEPDNLRCLPSTQPNLLET